MLKDNLYNDSINVLVFLFNFERKKDVLMKNYNPRFIKPLNYLSVSDVSKIVDITYSHTFKIINEVLIPHGLVNVEKIGRLCLISLTEKGLSIAKRQDSIFVDLKLLNY